MIIDNGHGRGTPGKCSPDGALREWAWTRRLAAELCRLLEERGIEAVRLVPEDADVALGERCRRANALAKGRRAVLVSLHTNASGSGAEWGAASGWSAFVAPGAGGDSRRLAALLWKRAQKAGLAGNRCTPAAGYWTAPLAICRGTVCPAVLTENMFHDNRLDVAFLLSDGGLDTIARVHVEALVEFFGL